MSLDEIKELLDLFNASGVGELEVERKDIRIKISRASPARDYVTAPAQPVISMTQMPAGPAAAGTPVSETVAAAVPAKAGNSSRARMRVKGSISHQFSRTKEATRTVLIRVDERQN